MRYIYLTLTWKQALLLYKVLSCFHVSISSDDRLILNLLKENLANELK